MKYLLTIALVSTLLGVGMPTIKAQIPIRDLQQSQGITISGNIRSVVGNQFILNDGSGEIIVNAGPTWHRKLNLQAGEKVTVTGMYHGDSFHAFTIKRQNGEAISIRNGYGPPPWARSGGGGGQGNCPRY
jgi:hypothetical protein